MQVEYNKEDHEPSYDNLTSPVKENKKTPKAYDITQVLTRPVFKWTALVVAVTTLIIVIVVPTVLEVTKQGKKTNKQIRYTYPSAISFCQLFCYY